MWRMERVGNPFRSPHEKMQARRILQERQSMKHASLNRKTTRQSPSFSHDHPGAGPNGVSLASPAYGIDFLDRQQKDTRFEPDGQAGPIQTQIPRGPYRRNPGTSAR